MAYQALYRVWRPQRFQDIVGQQLITKTLRQAVLLHKTSHAYLFTGPRGTGKTSAAKILAKAVNCLSPVDGEPCNECEACKAITAGSFNDVIEIDAASNNGVEEIRDIRDKARYAPTQGKVKVYIIDEVHMLSTGAFNALLKTLEEPPANVIFILATTEPHKIPATILSRTQRFDFKRITAEQISDRMAYILDETGQAYESEALAIIARAAQGGMRDALSYLDQAIACQPEKVTTDLALSVTGSLEKSDLEAFVAHVRSGEVSEALDILHRLLAQGKESGRIIEDFISYARDQLVQADGEDSPYYYHFIDLLNDTQQQLRFSSQPTVYLEVMTVKASRLKDQDEQHKELLALKKEVALLNEKLETISEEGFAKDSGSSRQMATKNGTRLDRKGPSQPHASTETADEGQATSVETKSRPKTHTAKSSKAFEPNVTKIHQILGQATKEDIAILQDAWQDILQMLKAPERAVLKSSKVVAAGPDGFVLEFPFDIVCTKAETSELHDAVESYLRNHFNYMGSYTAVSSQRWPSVRQDYIKMIHHQSHEQIGDSNDHNDSGNTDDTSSTLVEPPVAGIETEEVDVAKKAVDLFGSENVVVKD